MDRNCGYDGVCVGRPVRHSIEALAVRSKPDHPKSNPSGDQRDSGGRSPSSRSVFDFIDSLAASIAQAAEIIRASFQTTHTSTAGEIRFASPELYDFSLATLRFAPGRIADSVRIPFMAMLH
jgi:hypothetical protein